MIYDPPDLEPPSVKEELQQGEDGHVEVEVVTWITLSWVQKLATDEADQEETVNCQSHHLWKDRGYVFLKPSCGCSSSFCAEINNSKSEAKAFIVIAQRTQQIWHFGSPGVALLTLHYANTR